MSAAKDIRCVYCGQRGATMRGGRYTCFACRDLPTYERAASGEVEAMIAAYYEGKLVNAKTAATMLAGNT